MIKTLLVQVLLLCGLMNTGSVSGAAVQSPLRFRYNTNTIKDMIHLRDMEIFRAFNHIQLEGLKHASNVEFSLKPVSDHKWGFDFDFDVHFSKEYLGVESDKVQVKGTAKLADGTVVNFTAPVPLVKWQFALSTIHDKEFKIDRQEFKEKEWLFKTGAIDGKGLTPKAKEEIATAIDNFVHKSKDNYEVTKLTGEYDPMRYFPMESMIHLGIGRMLTNISQSVEFNDNYMELGFGLENFKMLSEKQSKALKEIKHDFFNEKNKDGQEALMQLAIDDNLFQSVASILTSIEKTFKVRPILEKIEQTAPHVHHLNTGILGKLFPSFAEKYGEDAPIDVILSPSHSLFKKGFPNAKMSGIQMDKKGNFKVQLNVPITVLVENKDKVWEEARQVYVTAVFKFKIGVNDKFPKFKKFNLTPKDLEVTNLKVLNDGQEEEMEQMMIQSVINIQLENLKNKFEDIPLLKRLLLKKIPKNVDCLGFNYADMDISFKKSMLVFSVYQKKAQWNHPFLFQYQDWCKGYYKELRDVSAHTYNHIENFAENDAVFDYIKIAQEFLAEGGATFNPLDGIVDKLNSVRAEIFEWKESYRLKEEEIQRVLDIRIVPEKEESAPSKTTADTTSDTTSDTTAETAADAPQNATVDVPTTVDAPSDTKADTMSNTKAKVMTYEEKCKQYPDKIECHVKPEEDWYVHDEL